MRLLQIEGLLGAAVRGTISREIELSDSKQDVAYKAVKVAAKPAIVAEESRDAKIARLMAEIANYQNQIVDTDAEYKAELRSLQGEISTRQVDLKRTLEAGRKKEKNCQPLDTDDAAA